MVTRVVADRIVRLAGGDIAGHAGPNRHVGKIGSAFGAQVQHVALGEDARWRSVGVKHHDRTDSVCSLMAWIASATVAWLAG
jgi:hypothetical protein